MPALPMLIKLCTLGLSMFLYSVLPSKRLQMRLDNQFKNEEAFSNLLKQWSQWSKKMLEKTVEKKNLKIPFQRKLYFSSLFVSFLLLSIGFALISIFPTFTLQGVIVFLLVYMFPALIGFDMISSYKEEFDIPKLIHPKRWTILCLTLICGWTIILWFVALYIACCPGKVSATTVKYNEVTWSAPKS